jgi:hypothetical protein
VEALKERRSCAHSDATITPSADHAFWASNSMRGCGPTTPQDIPKRVALRRDESVSVVTSMSRLNQENPLMRIYIIGNDVSPSAQPCSARDQQSQARRNSVPSRCKQKTRQTNPARLGVWLVDLAPIANAGLVAP